MRFKFAGNKKDVACVVIKNNDTNPIQVGAPVVLDFSSNTEIGCIVKSTTSLAAAEQINFFGVSLGTINNGQYGEAQVFGHNNIARVTYATRSATTAVWVSIAALSLGEVLTLGTGTGSAAGAGDQNFIRLGTTAAPNQGFAVAATTFASTTTNASSNGPQSATVWNTTVNIFLRAM